MSIPKKNVMHIATGSYMQHNVIAFESCLD